MDASKVGLGALLLGASGLTLTTVGGPGAELPVWLAGAAAVAVVTSAVVEAALARRLRR